MSMVNLDSGHLYIFTLLKHLMMLLKYYFSGLHFYTLPTTDTGSDHAAQIFLK